LIGGLERMRSLLHQND